MRLTSDKAQFAVEFLDLPEAAQIDNAKWESFQIDFLNSESRFAIDVKSRQIAWSFTAALDAVIDSILVPETPHIFVSINLDEAKEKIRYARSIIEALDAPVRPRLKSDSTTQIELDNGSRLISHPCRPVRGKARARIYLDEKAHYKEGLDREIYTAALPATVKGDGYIRIGSSPLGARGMFWEIYTQTLKSYPGYQRRLIPWWHIKALCRDVKQAIILAPQMLTQERVYHFGTQVLIDLYDNMLTEDFQQEFECDWVDESIAWITWETIKRNQQADLVYYHARSVDEAISMTEPIISDINQGKIEPVLTGGLDIGRKKDLTEFIALGQTTTMQRPVRFMVSLDRVRYDDQERCFTEVISRLPFTQVLIDRNGIGAQLAENLEVKTGKAIGVDFTNATKELWAVEARIQAERNSTPLPMDRDLAYQIHSIKKKVSAAKHNIFDTEKNEKHHADKFWAWALGIYAQAAHGTISVGLSPISNYRG